MTTIEQPQEPLGGPVEIAIPDDLYGKATAARWWVEEEQRAVENFLWDRAEAIRRALIRPFGLLYQLEQQALAATRAVTGPAAEAS